MQHLATAKFWMSLSIYISDILLIDSRKDVMGYIEVPSKCLISSEITLILRPKFKPQGTEGELFRKQYLEALECVLMMNVVE